MYAESMKQMRAHRQGEAAQGFDDDLISNGKTSGEIDIGYQEVVWISRAHHIAFLVGTVCRGHLLGFSLSRQHD